ARVKGVTHRGHAMKPLFVLTLFCIAAIAQDRPKAKTDVSESLAAFRNVQKEYSACLTEFRKSSLNKSFVEIDWDQERTCDRTYPIGRRNWSDAYPEAAAALALQQANRGLAVEALAKNATR